MTGLVIETERGFVSRGYRARLTWIGVSDRVAGRPQPLLRMGVSGPSGNDMSVVSRETFALRRPQVLPCFTWNPAHDNCAESADPVCVCYEEPKAGDSRFE